MLSDPIQITLLVVESMERLGISYLIGGSLSSSIHGIARATRDADIVAAIAERHADILAEALKDDFYADVSMIKDAIKHQSSFNLIHLDSMFKIDVYVLKPDEFSIEEFKRRQKMIIIPSPETTAYIATSEDTILSKLEWYKKGGEVSDRQWSDVLGVMKVQAERLDMDYLQHWANKLNITNLLKKALHEAGIGV